ncbi:MAG: hypothetical protein KDB53_06105 [Planctomycetes bacterium]|nr:hypothetical protein [Planctomycetota bacterium]
MAAEQASSSRPFRDGGEVREYNDRVWDMVLHLVHPVALYLVLAIGLGSRFMDHELLVGRSWMVFTAQFFGAWAVFYGTLLRDMGFRSLAGLALCLAVAIGLALSFWLAPHASSASPTLVRWLLGSQAGLVLMVWVLTFLRWRRLKRLCLAALDENDRGVA